MISGWSGFAYIANGKDVIMIETERKIILMCIYMDDVSYL